MDWMLASGKCQASISDQKCDVPPTGGRRALCYDARRKRTFREPDLVTVVYAGSARSIRQVVQPITPGQASFGMAIIGQKSSAGP